MEWATNKPAGSKVFKSIYPVVVSSQIILHSRHTNLFSLWPTVVNLRLAQCLHLVFCVCICIFIRICICICIRICVCIKADNPWQLTTNLFSPWQTVVSLRSAQYFHFVFCVCIRICILYFILVFVSSEIILDIRHIHLFSLRRTKPQVNLRSIARKNFTGHCPTVAGIEQCFIQGVTCDNWFQYPPPPPPPLRAVPAFQTPPGALTLFKSLSKVQSSHTEHP